MKKKLPVFQQKLVPVPAFPDDLVPFVERGGAVSKWDEGLLRQAELALLGLLAVRRGQSLEAPFRSEGDVGGEDSAVGVGLLVEGVAVGVESMSVSTWIIINWMNV